MVRSARTSWVKKGEGRGRCGLSQRLGRSSGDRYTCRPGNTRDRQVGVPRRAHRGQSEVEAAVDQEAKEPAITRGQNVVYQMPHDWASIAHVLSPVLDRIDEGIHDVQLLIVCADAEAAAGASASVVRLVGSRALNAIAATTARRAARLLRVGGAQ